MCKCRQRAFISRVTCFAILLQNKLKGDVTSFPTYVLTCLQQIRLLQVARILTLDCLKFHGSYAIQRIYVT